MAQCQFCGGQLNVPQRPPLTEECPSCKRDVHCCKQCHFFDPTRNNQCREPQADWVAEKERRNFCDFFRMSERPAARKNSKEDLEEKWKQMFKKE